MSIDVLTQKTFSEPALEAGPTNRKRSLAWLLPVGLLLGFLVIFSLLFGKRLLPGIAVETAPVVTIRAGELVTANEVIDTSEESKKVMQKGSLLFQASGWVEPDPYTVFIPTLVNGVVEEVHVLEGQAVKKGDLVATLVDDDAKLALKAAEQKFLGLEKKIVAHCAGLEIIDAQLSAVRRKIEALKTNLDEARDNSDRLGRLRDGVVSRQQLVQSRLATERQVAKLAEAEAQIPELEARRAQLDSEADAMSAALDELATARDRAQLALDRTKIRSSLDGVVLQLHAAPGKKRMLNMDSPTSAVIVELYDPNQLQARIDVPLNEAAALSVGQSVELVSDLLPNRTFTGTVTRISGQADLQRNTLQAKVEIHDPDSRLRPDMLMRAKFYASGSGQVSEEGRMASSDRLALYVPEESIVDGSQVWVVSPDRTAEKRKLSLGDITKDGHRLVLEGLRSGESVILPPHDKLEPGSRVKVTNSNR